MKKLFFAIGILFLVAGCNQAPPTSNVDHAVPWDSTLAMARGQTVTMMMWQGDPFINRYMQEWVVPAVQQQFGIALELIPGQGSDIVSLMMSELEAGQAESSVDMAWINGETFFQLREIDGLHGPFTQNLPNDTLIDWDNPFIGTDFQQKVDGYECPWGNVQLAVIYNADHVTTPPQTMADLETWVKANPGKFTIGSDFTGMTFLKALLSDLAGGKGALQGPFDAEKYAQSSARLWEYINRIKPYFWNQGTTFPADVAQMHQLFASGELWFTMSNNDSDVDNKIAQGLFPTSSRAYVPAFGSIQNSHYLGIMRESGHKAAAMVVCNFMISPAAQLKKMEPAVWGDGTILRTATLPTEWKQQFDAVPGRQFSPKRSEIQAKAIMEPAPEYMIHLFADFRKEVMEQ